MTFGAAAGGGRTGLVLKVRVRLTAQLAGYGLDRGLASAEQNFVAVGAPVSSGRIGAFGLARGMAAGEHLSQTSSRAKEDTSATLCHQASHPH